MSEAAASPQHTEWEEARRSIRRLPRTSLANLPTPLEFCERLSLRLNGPRIVIKRDDLTGLALGGSKTRQLEFVFGEVLQSGADCVVCYASRQSNYCRQVAAASAKLGLAAHLVLFGDHHLEVQGNLLLDELLGARIHLVSGGGFDQARVKAKSIADALTAEGARVYVMDMLGATSVIGFPGSLLGAEEVSTQLTQCGIAPSMVVLPTGSGGTQAGLALGLGLLGNPTSVLGISIRMQEAEVKAAVGRACRSAAGRLGIGLGLKEDGILVTDRYLAGGYGGLSPETVEAIRLVAETEGILLDPVYTGRAMAGLIAEIRAGSLSREDTVVFLHTGGQPALFAYSGQLQATPV